MKAISLIHFTLASINAFKFIRQMSAGVTGKERGRGGKKKKKGKKRKEKKKKFPDYFQLCLCWGGGWAEQRFGTRRPGGCKVARWVPYPFLPAGTALALITGRTGGDFGRFFAGFLVARLLRPSGGCHLPARHPDRRFLSVPRSASL